MYSHVNNMTIHASCLRTTTPPAEAGDKQKKQAQTRGLSLLSNIPEPVVRLAHAISGWRLALARL